MLEVIIEDDKRKTKVRRKGKGQSKGLTEAGGGGGI
jgi:hypothetical protein